MDPRTAEFYQSNADACLQRYESARMASLHQTLRRLVKPGDRVLDVGGGSGRDAAYLADLGCRVTYTDACPEMLEAACGRHPVLEGDAHVAAFPLEENDPLLSARFDFVLCLAVVMHLNDSDLCASASQIAQLTVSSGCAVISHSIGRLGLVDSRDSYGRLFRERTDCEVLEAFTRFGFATESRSIEADGLERSELQWITYVLRKVP